MNKNTLNYGCISAWVQYTYMYILLYRHVFEPEVRGKKEAFHRMVNSLAKPNKCEHVSIKIERLKSVWRKMLVGNFVFFFLLLRFLSLCFSLFVWTMVLKGTQILRAKTRNGSIIRKQYCFAYVWVWNWCFYSVDVVVVCT